VFYTWTGRTDNQKGNRFHEVVRNVDSEKLEMVNRRHFSLVGFESDEGVRRNQGRVGASKAPNKIRSFLSNISYSSNHKNVIDIGNVTCVDNNMEEAQVNLSEKVEKLLNNNYTPIILGGGHETFYGHYLGARKSVGENKKIGMINLDAHFDLRKDNVPSSGTMFNQILAKGNKDDYLCIGLQELSNTSELFLNAKELDVKYILETDLFPLEKTFKKIDTFAREQDFFIYTICSDVINQSSAPGVSAPAPFGLEPSVVRKITHHVIKQPNFLSMDVSEVNPIYDVADQTSRLISYIIGETLMRLNKSNGGEVND